jgi:hypothetical protein
MIHYILLGIFILFLSISLYIKIKFKFWSYQPVFHFYNLLYWISPPGIINKELPKYNKFTNLQNVQTKQFSLIKKHELKKTFAFIKSYYLQTKDIQFNPSYKNIIPYFKNHEKKSYFSFYTQPTLLIDHKNNDSIPDKETFGVITSRPLYITHNSKTFMIYYVDYLCIHDEYRKKGIAPELIQTHIYNQSKENNVFDIYFFKRETNLTGIVPFVVYKTYGFELQNASNILKGYSNFNKYHLIEITKKNIRLFIDFLKQQKNKTIILPCISNLYELIKSNVVTIYILMNKNIISAAYLFKETNTEYKSFGSVSCFGSAFSSTENMNGFFKGFVMAYEKAIQKYKAKYICIEDIADNIYIINKIKQRVKPFMISPTAFFFYNYALRPIESKDILAIY